MATTNDCLASTQAIIQGLSILPDTNVIIQLVRQQSEVPSYPAIILSPLQETQDYITGNTKRQITPIQVDYVDQIDTPGATLLASWASAREKILDAFPFKHQAGYPSYVVGVDSVLTDYADTTEVYQRVVGRIVLNFWAMRQV